MKTICTFLPFLFFAITGFAQSPGIYTRSVQQPGAKNIVNDFLQTPQKRKLNSKATYIFEMDSVNPFLYDVSVDGTNDFVTYPQSKDSLLPMVFSPFSLMGLFPSSADKTTAAIGDSLSEKNINDSLRLLREEYARLMDWVSKLNDLEFAKSQLRIVAEFNDNETTRKTKTETILEAAPFNLSPANVDNPDQIYFSMWNIYAGYQKQLDSVYNTIYDLQAQLGTSDNSKTNTKANTPPRPSEIKKEEKKSTSDKNNDEPSASNETNPLSTRLNLFLQQLNTASSKVNETTIKGLFTDITMMASQLETTPNVVYSSPVIPEGDELTVNVSVTPRNDIVYRKYNIMKPQSFSVNYWVFGKWDASISAGLGFTPMSDAHYSIQSATFNDTTFKLNSTLGFTDTISSIQKVDHYHFVRQPVKGLNPGISLMVNFTCRIGYNLSVGGGFGTFVDGDKRTRYIIGPSVVLGHHSRVVISGGVIAGKVGRLEEGYDENTYYKQSFSNGAPYRFIPQASYFFGISYNLSYNKISQSWGKSKPQEPKTDNSDAKKEK